MIVAANFTAASNTKFVVTGDKALQATSGYHGITVCSPRHFVDEWHD